jgi:hypothetical protein
VSNHPRLARSLRLRSFVFLLACSVVPLTACTNAESGERSRAEPQCSGRAVLASEDRAGFVGATLSRADSVVIALLSTVGCEAAMFRSLGNLGATAVYADPKTGYAVVRLSKSKLDDLLDLGGVAYAQVQRVHSDESVIPPDSLAKLDRLTTAPFEIAYPRLATTLPANGVYFPAEEGGLTELWKEHPTADGRGVRVGIADDGFDLLHPALQKARDANGALIPKVADIDLIGFDDSWVRMGERLTPHSGIVRALGKDWHVPTGGPFRFGAFGQRQRLTGEHAKMVDLVAGMIWEETTATVWVDTNGDGDFRNDQPLRDYSVAQEIGWFGTKDDRGDHRIPFGVKIDTAHTAVTLAIGGSHGASIVGTIAANDLTGGIYNAAAPSVQVVDVRWGYAGIGSQLNIYHAITRPDIDVVHMSGGIGGTEFDLHVFERALAVHQKPLSCLNALPNALRVNEYLSPELLRRNVQIPPPYGETYGITHHFFPVNGVINGVLVPSQALSIQSRYVPNSTMWSDGRLHFMAGKEGQLSPTPMGYVTGGSLSSTIPYGSGVVADLIGEARRLKVRHDYLRVINAIQISARLIPGVPASEQHHGVIDAAAAWRQLQDMERADDPENPMLTRFKVARDSGGSRMAVQGFHLDWVAPGTTVDGALWITRTGGRSGPRAYTMWLHADDSTYTLLDSSAIFVRDSAVRVRFRARVRPGRHVAFLLLRDEQAGAVMNDVPLYVSAPEAAAPVSPGVDRYASRLAPLAKEYKYIAVEPDVQAVHYAVDIPYSGTARISPVWLPGGFRNRAMDAPAGPPVDAAHNVGPMLRHETLTRRRDSVNEVLWSSRGVPQAGTVYDAPGPTVPIDATLTVSKYSMAFEAKGPRTVMATNRLAPINGRVELFDAAVTKSEEKGSGPRAQVEIRRKIPSGVAQWRVSVSGPKSSAGVDAYLVSCSDKGECYPKKQVELKAGKATLVVDDPAAGEWIVLVRSRDPLRRSASYRIVDAVVVPTATPLETTDQQHASGDRWSIRLPPAAGARYAGFRMIGGAQTGATAGLRIAITPLAADLP